MMPPEAPGMESVVHRSMPSLPTTPPLYFLQRNPYGLDCKIILLLDYRKRRYYHKYEPCGRDTFFEVPILFLHLCSKVCKCHTEVKHDSIYKIPRTVSGIWQVLNKWRFPSSGHDCPEVWGDLERAPMSYPCV